MDFSLYKDGLDFLWNYGGVPRTWNFKSLHWPEWRPRPGMGYVDYFNEGKFVTRRFFHYSGHIANEECMLEIEK